MTDETVTVIVMAVRPIGLTQSGIKDLGQPHEIGLFRLPSADASWTVATLKRAGFVEVYSVSEEEHD